MEKSTNFALVESFAMEGPHGTIYQPVEYVWIGGTGQDIRSKTKMYQRKIESLKDLEEWNFDGSSTRQATTEASEVILKPVALFRDPFRKPNGLIALCETFMPDGRPAPCNFRNTCAKVMQEAEAQKPWFGIEQEYVILVHKGTTFKYPLGWPEGGFPGQQGPYYCAVGAGNCFGRELVEYHMKCCVYAGLQFAGINGEVLPAQWEFQIGPAEGINIGDHLWMARYFLARAAEFFNWDVSFDPKPVPGDWNGAGAHCNYSTLDMRNKGGYAVVEEFMPKLSAKHKDHLRVYGEGNESRLTGKHETSSMETFSYGVGSRAASVRIPTSTQKNGYGYIEDRRPAACADPYLVSGMIVDTTLLNGKYGAEIIKQYEESGCSNIKHGWKSF